MTSPIFARFLLVLLFVSACLVAVSEAQGPPCVWSAPTFSKRVDALSSMTKIDVSCGGGIVGCKGRVVVNYWIWNDDDGSWHPSGLPGPWENHNVFKNCGESWSYSEVVAHSVWPANSLVCVTLNWYKWNSATQRYVFVSDFSNVYETPQ